MRSADDPRLDLSAAAGKHLLIALSGGPDSVALAVLLAEHRREYDLELSAAHLDHAIRSESADDADFCRALCGKLDIPLHTVRMDIARESAETGIGLETLARQRRYEWLRRVKEQIGADYIALAHHMDDQAETVLMHLSRGAGPEGIVGMRALSGDLFRPLLGFRKRELTDFLRGRHIPWREDATNGVDDTPRNAIRLNVIPELEKSYPRFVSAASRFAYSAQIESEYVASMTRAYLDKKLVRGPYGAALDLSEPVPRAILRRAIRAICGSDLPWSKLNEIEVLCRQQKGRLDVSGRLCVERTGSRIYFARRDPPTIAPVPLLLDGVTRLDGLCAISARPHPPTPVRDDPTRQVLRLEALAGAVLRTRRAGDRFRPLGCGDKKLSDYLVDRKVDRPLRDFLPLVAVGDRVLWVCGMGISEDARITGASDKAVELKYTVDITDEKTNK